MENWIVTILVAALTAIIAFIGGWIVSKYIGKSKVAKAEKMAEKIVNDAQKEASNIKREKVLEAKEEWHRLKQTLENETKTKRSEISKLENKCNQRELNLDRRNDLLNQKERSVNEQDKRIKVREEKCQKLEGDLEQLIEEQNKKLESISGISNEEAKKILMQNLVDKAKQAAAKEIKEIKDNARQMANREAKEIIIQAIQRTAADHSTETTVSVVSLPGDDMKGRIIGREGRNIRSFETATGVEVIVDDTPEAVVLSGFDPFRREVARVALERLVQDGRIHPARIEEVVKKVHDEMEEKLMEIGESAVFETGITGVHNEIVRLLGKLKYRTSYGQNVLQHSIEVAYVTGLLASSLGFDGELAKRAGLMHDIGKAIDRYTEGTHTQIGVEIAKKCGEGPIVLNAIASHHEDVEPTHPISVLVQAADAISGSRPGARRETLESYIKRLDKLESVANSFPGVEKSYAIQAGREIRVIVEHEKIGDDMCEQLSADIAEKIQQEMEYPGQIKVTVIREYRAIEYAK